MMNIEGASHCQFIEVGQGPRHDRNFFEQIKWAFKKWTNPTPVDSYGFHL
jgi:hypothetical protein